MAIPTLTGLVPPSGAPLGGYVVVLQGTNFREPTSTPFGPKELTVRVYIGGAQIPDSYVEVISDTEIEVRMLQDERDPSGTVYPLDLDVEVVNVDSAGVPIPGESVTLVDGWSYVRLSDAGSVPEEAVFRWLRRYLARNLPIQVTGTVHVDYQSDGLLTLPQEVVAPCVVLLGPRLEPSPGGTQGVQNLGGVGGELRLPKCWDHVWDIILVDTNRKRLGVLRSQVQFAVQSMPAFLVSWAGGDALVQARWDTPLSMVSQSDFSGAVEQATGTVRVENVPEVVDMVAGEAVDVDTVELLFP